MKLVLYLLVFANLWLHFNCTNMYLDMNRNFYLISMTEHGETEKYVHYNELTAKESILKAPSDR